MFLSGINVLRCGNQIDGFGISLTSVKAYSFNPKKWN